MQVSNEKHKLYDSHRSIVYDMTIFFLKIQLQFHGDAS